MPDVEMMVINIIVNTKELGNTVFDSVPLERKRLNNVENCRRRLAGSLPQAAVRKSLLRVFDLGQTLNWLRIFLAGGHVTSRLIWVPVTEVSSTGTNFMFSIFVDVGAHPMHDLP